MQPAGREWGALWPAGRNRLAGRQPTNRACAGPPPRYVTKSINLIAVVANGAREANSGSPGASVLGRREPWQGGSTAIVILRAAPTRRDEAMAWA
jgi:hypothetical protein